MALLDKALEQGLLPEFLIRWGIRKLLADTLKKKAPNTPEQREQQLAAFVEELKRLPIAIETDAANEQHYELPAEFFNLVLGPHRKYSSGLWPEGVTELGNAEALMLEMTCERAQLEDGQNILELGCGWGSLSLWMAERYPNATITVISNSASQREFIEFEASKRLLKNLRVITANIVTYDTDEQYDRIVSVEMLEHMKNYQRLFEKISRWLKPEGRFFTHIFTHKTLAYHYEDEGEHDWLTRYFFSGGTMPSNDLFSRFQEHIKLLETWEVNGTHYQKTAEAWLRNLKNKQGEVFPILEKTYGKKHALKWFNYWAVFFMACAELWGYKNGTEWMVCHYLFERQPAALSQAPENQSAELISV